MLGLLKPSEGEVFVGDTPLSKIDQKAYRDQIASVMQEDQLFAGSIIDNITFFDTQADMESVANCACIAAIHHEIEAMPMGYNTLIGDMGTVLSSGQKQRILLARALYKRPKILYMDEATSHLDVANEKKVNEALQHLNITTVIIAHRPQTIASVERVIYLGPGGVKEARHQTQSVAVSASPGRFGPAMQTPSHALP
jgi:ATP-binding cassette subfamily B protein RaxB